MKSLKQRVQEFEVLLPFMENREKGDLAKLVGMPFTLSDYGFMIDDKKQEYSCFITKEDNENFYFGGMVLTEHLKELEDEDYHETIVAEGLPILLGKKTSKNKMTYTTVKFYPEG